MLETYDTPTFDTVKDYTPEYAIVFKEWCHTHNAYYYGKPGSDFNIYEARYLASEAGADILILDNLS